MKPTKISQRPPKQSESCATVPNSTETPWLTSICAEIRQHHREKIGDDYLSEPASLRLFFHSLKGWFSERQREQAGMLEESFLQWLTEGQLVEGILAFARARRMAVIPHAAHMVWLRGITDRIRDHYRTQLGNQRLSKPAVSKLFFEEITSVAASTL